MQRKRKSMRQWNEAHQRRRHVWRSSKRRRRSRKVVAVWCSRRKRWKQRGPWWRETIGRAVNGSRQGIAASHSDTRARWWRKLKDNEGTPWWGSSADTGQQELQTRMVHMMLMKSKVNRKVVRTGKLVSELEKPRIQDQPQEKKDCPLMPVEGGMGGTSLGRRPTRPREMGVGAEDSTESPSLPL